MKNLKLKLEMVPWQLTLSLSTKYTNYIKLKLKLKI